MEDQVNPSQTGEGSQRAPADDTGSDDVGNRTPKTAGVHIDATPKVRNKVRFGGEEFEPPIVYTQPEIFVTTQYGESKTKYKRNMANPIEIGISKKKLNFRSLPIFGRFAILGWIRSDLTLPIAIIILRFLLLFDLFYISAEMCVEY